MRVLAAANVDRRFLKMLVLRFFRLVLLLFSGGICFTTTFASPLSPSQGQQNPAIKRKDQQLVDINNVASCGLSGYFQCSFSPSTWPASGFCCPSTSHCHVLDRGSTLLCCPSSVDEDGCTSLEPIPCPLGLQNATLHPESMLKTTRRGKLPHCGGDTCCPFGYRCVHGRRGRYCELADTEIKATLDEDEGVAGDIEGHANGGVQTVPFATKVPAAATSAVPPPSPPDLHGSTAPNRIVLRRHDEGFDVRLFVMGFFCALGVASIAVLFAYFAVKYKWLRNKGGHGRRDKEKIAFTAPVSNHADDEIIPPTTNGHDPVISPPAPPPPPTPPRVSSHHTPNSSKDGLAPPTKNLASSKIGILPNCDPRGGGIKTLN